MFRKRNTEAKTIVSNKYFKQTKPIFNWWVDRDIQLNTLCYQPSKPWTQRISAHPVNLLCNEFCLCCKRCYWAGLGLRVHPKSRAYSWSLQVFTS